MWRRRLGAVLLRSPLSSSSSSTASSSSAHWRHRHLLPTEEPLAVNRLVRLFTSQAGSDGGPSQKPFVAFVLGSPGSGKGTQCTKIASDYGFAHLSAGDLLRHEISSGSEKGELILDIIKDGRIVPSEITVELIRKAVESSNAKRVLIDGFPRSEENRIAFEKITGTEPDIVIFFDCPEDEMIKRLLGRNQGRVDDNIETIKKRLKVFESLNIPVVDYYSSRGKVHKINATGTSDEIFEAVRKLFSSLRYVGFYKGVQSAGAAVAWQIDTHKTSLMSQLIVNWGLMTVSYPLLAVLVFLAVKDDDNAVSSVEDGNKKGTKLAAPSSLH